MPVWKKVLVSGSAIEVTNVTASVAVAVGSTQTITTSPSTTVLSGSFSGSFVGNGSGLTGIAASSLANSLTHANNSGIVPFSFNGSSAQTIAVSGAASLTNNLMTKWNGAAFVNSSLTDNGTTVSGTTSIQLTGANTTLTGSFSGSHFGPLTGTASYASNAAQVQASLTHTNGAGITPFSYNGNTAVQISVSGASALTTNILPKINASKAFVDSNITDTGTQVQIAAGASSGLSVAAGGITVSAGGVNVTGNSTFNNNLTVTGDLTVAGTASFTNTDNLNVRDKFILINSGSSALADSGWITQYNAAGSGSAFYLETATAGTYGRFAVAYDIVGTATSLTVDEFVVTAKVAQAAAPGVSTPTWGGSGNNGQGNMWVTTGGDIYIWA